MRQTDCRGVYVCLFSFDLEEDEGLLPALRWGCKRSIPFFVSTVFREIVSLLLFIKNLIYKAKIKATTLEEKCISLFPAAIFVPNLT